MDQILRGQEVAEIAYMPVRHHSPACAYHVREMIREWEPDCILIEGPENANRLIPVMTHPDTRAPFAIYYSYRDRKGYVSEEKADYRCYYPFLDYSPELAALREAAARGIPARFIDLPYGEILTAVREGRGLRRGGEKNNYNDDYLLARSAYIQRLCEKTGARNFDELWEKYFEQNGLYEDRDTFIAHMLAYCGQARESTLVEELEQEGCLKREQCMAWHIREAAKTCRRILAVTGGFHTPGIRKLLEEGDVKLTLTGIPQKDQGVFLLPYSMEACASLNGYASGMPYPEFYQQIWDGIEAGREEPYREAVLNGLVAVGRMVRKEDGLLSSYDEICGFSMARGLAGLRNKREPGAYELYDSVLSSFVKGACDLSTDQPLRLLRDYLTGRRTGTLCAQAEVPPIIQDFEKQCKDFKLKTGSTLEQEVTLDIFASEKHRSVSMFLNQMVFLDTGFCRKKRGPDLQKRKDRNLIRETWRYKWNAQVLAALTDVSVYGATVREACAALVLRSLKEKTGGKEAAVLLTRVFEMGLEDQLELVYEQVYRALLEDGDFYSVAEALSYLVLLGEMGELYQSSMDVGGLILICIRKLTALLPGMAQVQEEQTQACMEACKTLYQLTGQEAYGQEREALCQAFLQIVNRQDGNPGLDGCVRGILYGAGIHSLDQIRGACAGYLTGTHEQLMKSASFFRGLFFTARDLVFIGDGLVGTMDQLIRRLDSQSFMALLPEFRMAFSYFTPREIDQIAGQAAALYGRKKKDLFALKEVTPAVYDYGRRLDQLAAGMLAEREDGK